MNRNVIKTIRKIIIVFLIITMVLWALSLISGYSFIIPVTKLENSKTVELTKGDIINPLKNFDFEKGNWVAYLVISRTDFKTLNPALKRTNCSKLNNIKLLKQMQNSWYFQYTGGDVATAESSIYFFRDEKLIFKSGIILDNEFVGLQSSIYGWIEPKDNNAIIESCKNFKKVNLPIIFL